MKPTTLAALTVLALSPSAVLASSVGGGSNVANASTWNTGGGFPSVCKTPSFDSLSSVPYPSLRSSTKPKVVAKTATKGDQTTEVELDDTVIDVTTILAAVANTEAVLQDLMNDRPPITPASCSGPNFEHFWDAFEAWQATVYEVILLMIDLRYSADLLAAQARNSQAADHAEIIADQAARSAQYALQNAILLAIATCSEGGDPRAVASSLDTIASSGLSRAERTVLVQQTSLNALGAARAAGIPSN